MIEVHEAHDIIKNVCIQSSEFHEIDIKNAIGCTLAEDIRALESLPSFPCSTMDGYAVIASDGEGNRMVIDGIAAGDAVNYKSF